ncbi:MAG TPA: thioredoxin domain-containing protein [Actinospica sp.]|nr:thioredoxin domain-containing protein [Actinospica sp.]
MSKSDQEAKRSARERAAAAQALERRKAKRRRQYLILGIVVVVIGAIVGIGLGVKSSNSPASPFTAPNAAVVDSYVNAQTKTGDPTAIQYGSPDAKVTMTVFEDVRCPFCDIFEVGARDAYKKYVDAGEVQVMFHIVKLIDVNDQASGQNATGSRNGGSALACAQNAGMFDAYHDVLYDNQPVETTDPWSQTSALITLAKQVPGLDTPTFESCVDKVAYGGFVDQNWSDFNTLKLQGTPTVELNGSALTNAQLFSASSKAGVTASTASDGEGANTAAVQAAIQAAVTKAYGSSTPAPWASASASASATTSGSASASASAAGSPSASAS